MLAIYPADDHLERLYSIGLVNNELQLSVRLHEGGLGSGFPHRLKLGEKNQARIVRNKHFYFPNSVTDAKFNYKGTLHTINTPFDGTRDTTIYANIGESVSLDAKSTGGLLKGQILVEGILVSELVDADTDQDGKTQVKLNFTVK